MKVDAFGIAGSKTIIRDFTVLLGQRASAVTAKRKLARNSNRAKRTIFCLFYRVGIGGLVPSDD